jgi:hypothetical protein
MHLVKSLLLAGGAVAGLGLLAPVLADEWNSHRLTVRLPGGGVETIEYSGNAIPRLILQPAPWQPFNMAWSGFPLAGPSFADLDRMMADMDRQMAVMMRQADVMTRLPQGPALNQAVLEGLPPGTTSFSMVQTSTGNGVCTRVTRITQGAQDARPQVVSQTSGCGESVGEAAPPKVDIRQINYRLPDAPAPRSGL